MSFLDHAAEIYGCPVFCGFILLFYSGCKKQHFRLTVPSSVFSFYIHLIRAENLVIESHSRLG